MRSIRYNPAKGWKSEKRKLAEKIAAEKKIKVASAMRYIQRVVAPIGKQRIAKPKFTGLRKKTAGLVKAEMVKFQRESFKKQLEQQFFSPLTHQAILDYVKPQVDIDSAKPVKLETKFGRSLKGDWIDELAIACNVLGVDNLADVLGLDGNDILDVISGEDIDLRLRRSIVYAFRDFKNDPFADQRLLRTMAERGAVVRETVEGLKDDYAEIIREAIALGKINLEFINSETSSLWNKQLTENQGRKILEAAWLEQYDGVIDFNQMFAAFYADGKSVIARKGGFLDESIFWAWYREIFYHEQGD